MPGDPLQCLQNARCCVVLAEQACASHRPTLLQLSDTWLSLAAELERAQTSGSIGPQKGAVEDKLLTLIKRYEADLQEIHTFPDIPDEVFDAMMERTLERLTEAIDVPSLTAASALAALDLLAEELIEVPENPDEQTNYERCMGALMSAVRGYVASTAAQ